MSSLPERLDALFADSFTLPDAIVTMGRAKGIGFARRGDGA
jgi:hypothetical protein